MIIVAENLVTTSTQFVVYNKGRKQVGGKGLLMEVPLVGQSAVERVKKTYPLAEYDIFLYGFNIAGKLKKIKYNK